MKTFLPLSVEIVHLDVSDVLTGSPEAADNDVVLEGGWYE